MFVRPNPRFLKASVVVISVFLNFEIHIVVIDYIGEYYCLTFYSHFHSSIMYVDI